MRVLVIEDEQDLLQALGQSLHEAGYAVDEVSDGTTGLRKALEVEYDGVILDVMLPGMNGFELLQNLRRSKTTPVLMLTARDGLGDRVTGLDAGADDYLIKPFELPELLARVRAIIRRGAGGSVSSLELGEITGKALIRTISRLESAHKVQMRFTPQAPPEVPGVDVAFACRQAQAVGGDYYDVWTLQDGRLAFMVADVEGHGFPAAMVMANLQASIHAGTDFCDGLSEAVDYVNHHLKQHLAGGPFITLFLGLLEVDTGRVEYVNAGHPPPLLVGPELTGRPLDQGDNTVLGVGSGHFIAGRESLVPGSCIVAFTDGITESESPDGILFGMSRLQKLVQSARGKPAAGLVREIIEAEAAFRGASPQADDITVLAVRWLGDSRLKCPRCDHAGIGD